jgi:hypothetical protein
VGINALLLSLESFDGSGENVVVEFRGPKAERAPQKLLAFAFSSKSMKSLIENHFLTKLPTC